jgi:cyanamide hydratase
MSSERPTLGALAFELGQLQNERDLQQLLAQRATELRLPVPLVDLAKLPLPDSPLARDCAALAEKTLQRSVFLHSMRVYYFGVIVAQDQFPSWKLNPETYFVTSMLHDLGLVRETILASGTSKKYAEVGADLAMEYLRTCPHSSQCPPDRCAHVWEAIAHHNNDNNEVFLPPHASNVDLCLCSLAAYLDVRGTRRVLWHDDSLRAVNRRFDRTGFADCFSGLYALDGATKGYPVDPDGARLRRENVLNSLL